MPIANHPAGDIDDVPGTLARVFIRVSIGQVRDACAIGRPEKGCDMVILLREQAGWATRSIDQLQRPIVLYPTN